MNMGNMREISIEECMRVSGGGKITELYVDNDGVWLVTHDENGNFLYEVKLSNGAGAGWDGGFFGCVGIGNLGATAGGCVGTNPFDGYVYAGAGTPGPSVNGGYATDTSTYLTGAGLSYVGPGGVGAGTTIDGQATAIQAGIPGASATYGVSITEVYNSVVDSLGNISNAAAKAFFDKYYYPHLDRLTNPDR